MKKIIILLVFTILTFNVYSQTKSYKRGVAYGYHTISDIQNFSPYISWWYNWSYQPESAVRSSYMNYGLDFTPMAWNSSGINGVGSYADRDTTIRYILGFNEPNFKEQANMTPTQSAKAWPALQKIAVKHDLKIVSPAVNYCGTCVTENGTTYTNPFTYLDDFFKACDTCQVDFIGLHWYGSGNSIVNYVNTARKYKKPIWVTEFASWDYSNPVKNINDQKNYLAGTVNFLERDSDIYRYSWFIGRTSGGISAFPYIDLYGASGELTELGEIYMNILVYNPDQKFEIPGRIESEEYYRMSGLFCELSADVDGFLNVGWTDYGDWAEYKISVSESGTYNIIARIAGTSTGRMDILVDNVLLKTLTTPNTGGWQNWQDLTESIDLEAGEHLLKWRVRTAGFNVNWLELSLPTAVKNEIEVFKTEIYPNPVSNGLINVEINREQAGGKYDCQLFDIYGKLVYNKKVNVTRALFQINIFENYRLPSGTYILKISGKQSMANQLVVVQ